jgi:hypothetical protein
LCPIPEDAEEIILIIAVCGQLGHFISGLLIDEEEKNSHAGIKPTPPPSKGNGKNYFAGIKKKSEFPSIINACIWRLRS